MSQLEPYNELEAKDRFAEARATIIGLLQRRTGCIPPELIADHILRVTKEMDWPVQLTACEEILKRFSSVHRDKLTVMRRPKTKSPFGIYRTGNQESGLRPYRTRLFSTDSLALSCDCPDFLNNSLGLCKHALTVLLSFNFNKMPQISSVKRGLSVVRWNPVRPALGFGDPLSSILVTTNGDDRSRPLWNLQKLCKRISKDEWVIRDEVLADPVQRHSLVELLLTSKELIEEDPALKALLHVERSRLAKGDLNGESLVNKHLPTLKKKLFPYQKESIARFIEKGSFLIGDDMGLGKTAQAIAACHVLFRAKKVTRGLLIVPASLKTQWEREWGIFTDTPVCLIEGRAEDRAAILCKMKSGFAIANYEQILRDIDLFREWEPDLIVLDEAQRIKNWETKTSAYIKTFNPRFRLVLTGTPFENRLQELASILDWVDPRALEPRWRLVPWHTIYADGSTEIVGARNLGVIRERLAHCFIRRTRKEVLSQLPERQDIRVPIKMTDSQLAEHAAFNEPIVKLMAIAKKRPLTQQQFVNLMTLLLKQRLVANGMALYDFERFWPEIEKVSVPSDEYLQSLSSQKLIEFREIIHQALTQGRKVVVFSQWRRMLALANWCIGGILKEGGFRAAFFTGQESQKRRTQNIVEFHDDPKLRVLFLTDAGGVGLNLQRASDCCINLDLPWNPAVLEQRIARIYRLGQTNPIDVFALISEWSIEGRIANLIGSKQALFSELFEGTSDYVQFSDGASLASFLNKIVEPVKVPLSKKSTEPVNEEDSSTENNELAPEDSLPITLEDQPTQEFQSPSDSTLKPGELLSNFEVTKLSDGRMQIVASPEASLALASLLESFAASLRKGV